jgi:sugar phosphate isomerase/epimerase
MLTRRNFLGKAAACAAAGAFMTGRDLWAAEHLAWPGPIGLELYTVRQMFAKDPAGTLKAVAAAGYKEVEIGPGVKPTALNADLQAAGLTAPSGYFETPRTIEDWKRDVEMASGYGLKYIVVGENPKLDADQWRKRAEFFSQCGGVALAADIQFCYHAHFHEFAKVDGTTGYDILLANCSEKLLKMEMDIFWVMYAGADPLAYWHRYPGRFPLLHIKDIRKGVTIHHQENPAPNGPNPFAPVGQGTIDWKRIFEHVGLAGAKHIYVEQDQCNMPPLEAIKISYEYLRKLRVA